MFNVYVKKNKVNYKVYVLEYAGTDLKKEHFRATATEKTLSKVIKSAEFIKECLNMYKNEPLPQKKA